MFVLHGKTNNSRGKVDGSGKDFEVDKKDVATIPSMDVTKETDSQGIHSPIIAKRGIRIPDSNSVET